MLGGAPGVLSAHCVTSPYVYYCGVGKRGKKRCVTKPEYCDYDTGLIPMKPAFKRPLDLLIQDIITQATASPEHDRILSAAKDVALALKNMLDINIVPRIDDSLVAEIHRLEQLDVTKLSKEQIKDTLAILHTLRDQFKMTAGETSRALLSPETTDKILSDLGAELEEDKPLMSSDDEKEDDDDDEVDVAMRKEQLLREIHRKLKDLVASLNFLTEVMEEAI
jgi:hypothetical protein